MTRKRTTTPHKSTANAPIEVIHDGAIKASIWSNESENGEYLTATFARTYTKGDRPQDTHTFTGRDLLVVSQLALRAYYWGNKHRAQQDAPEPE